MFLRPILASLLAATATPSTAATPIETHASCCSPRAHEHTTPSEAHVEPRWVTHLYCGGSAIYPVFVPGTTNLRCCHCGWWFQVTIWC